MALSNQEITNKEAEAQFENTHEMNSQPASLTNEN